MPAARCQPTDRHHDPFTLDPVNNTAGMLSIPRDLWVRSQARLRQDQHSYSIGESFQLPGGSPVGSQDRREPARRAHPLFAQIDFKAVDFINQIDGVKITTNVQLNIVDTKSQWLEPVPTPDGDLALALCAIASQPAAIFPVRSVSSRSSYSTVFLTQYASQAFSARQNLCQPLPGHPHQSDLTRLFNCIKVLNDILATRRYTTIGWQMSLLALLRMDCRSCDRYRIASVNCVIVSLGAVMQSTCRTRLPC